MTIQVRFFAALREKVGMSSFDVALAAGSDLTDLLAVLQVELRTSAFDALRAPNVRIAVNREFIEAHHVLHDGDEVAFMPPITGG